MIFRKKQSILRSFGRLHWLHWFVIALSLFLTIFAWQYSQVQVEDKLKLKFDREVEQIISLIEERMQKYEEALWAGTAYIIAVNNQLTHQDWVTYSKVLQLEEKYPGINGIGVIYSVPFQYIDQFKAKYQQDYGDIKFTIYPKHDKEHFLPITYIEPLDNNRAALGLDMAHEDNRYTAAMLSLNTGKAQITGPIVLVQDKEKTPGFLFYVPFYEQDLNLTTDELTHLSGLVYAPFIVAKLMSGVLSQENRKVSLNIYDESEVIYSEELDDKQGNLKKLNLTTSITKNMYGRQWTYQISANSLFSEIEEIDQPIIILISGLVINALLLFVFFVLSNSNRKARQYADLVTKELQSKQVSLERSNAELESFAYITSHDLRSPLRGIESLATWVQEDKGNELSKQSEDYLNKLIIRTHRLDKMISGILAYSKAYADCEEKEKVDVRQLIKETIDLLNPSRHVKISIADNMPTIVTTGIRLKQVFSNLLENAIKYTVDMPCEIEIGCAERDDCYEFFVRDYGVGIDKKFSEKVFQIFQTAHSGSGFYSTGIGLSLVKKIVESNDGKIWFDSEPGEGTTFYFTWPRNREV